MSWTFPLGLWSGGFPRTLEIPHGDQRRRHNKVLKKGLSKRRHPLRSAQGGAMLNFYLYGSRFSTCTVPQYKSRTSYSPKSNGHVFKSAGLYAYLTLWALAREAGSSRRSTLQTRWRGRIWKGSEQPGRHRTCSPGFSPGTCAHKVTSEQQCCGSMKFWHGSGSADLYL